MDTNCLQYCLTAEERTQFEERGYFILDQVLSPEMVTKLTAASDRVDAAFRAKEGLGPHDRSNVMGFAGEDELFLELVDWPRTFPKVWGILGWNIQLYHAHMTITPPNDPGLPRVKQRLHWHQDSGRLNKDIESIPRPRISLKVAYFLSDTTEEGRANFYVIPGSHLSGRLDLPGDGVSDPDAAVPVRVPPGTAVLFDRRLWHSASENFSDVTRKVLFYGYSYRWLRPRDDMSIVRFMDRCDPIRQQLLGASATGGRGFTSPEDADVPLRAWLAEHLGEEAVVA